MAYTQHPHTCGGPGSCGQCDAILDARNDRTPSAGMVRAEAAQSAAIAAMYDPASGPACTVRWRDDWRCMSDATGLHTCRRYGPHPEHACDASQRTTDAELARGSRCADGHAATMRPGLPHHLPLPVLA